LIIGHFRTPHHVHEGSVIALQSVLVMECSKAFYMETNFTLGAPINSFANKSAQLAEVARNVLCRGIVFLLPPISEEHMHF